MTYKQTFRSTLLFGALIIAAFLLSNPSSAQDTPTNPTPPAIPQLITDYNQARADIADSNTDARLQLIITTYDNTNTKNDTQTLTHLQSELSTLSKDLDEFHPATLLLEKVTDQAEAAHAAQNPDFKAMLFAVIGGLGIFLLGMKNMSDGMQAIAGARLRAMINAVTDNRILATGVGTGVTCLVQSSSITTVIVVGLVNSGLMALHQAIGVIMGANIGTTITGWILVLKVGKYGLPILGVSAFIYLFSKTDRWRYLAMSALGLGMVFFGLEMMKNGFKPMKGVPEFTEAFLWFDASSYFGVLKCALIGCVLTFIVQSSSATLGITIGLASTGAIPFETAAALVLGENIGTTITAWLASFGTTTVAKRAAYAHVAFNIIGVAWITALFFIYIELIGVIINYTQGHNPLNISLDSINDPLVYGTVVTAGIATTHTIFNIVNTLIFLPFVRQFANILERLIPDKGTKEVGHLSHLDIRMVESPVMGIEQSRGEIIKMSKFALKMLRWTKEIIHTDSADEDLEKKVFNREQIMDNMQAEIIAFLTEILSGSVPHNLAEEARIQLRVADEIESVSDYTSAVLKAHIRISKAGLELTQNQKQYISELHDQVEQYITLVATAIEENQSDVLTKAQTLGDSITIKVKDLREHHLIRLAEIKIDPVHSMSYTGMLNAYRKIKDHGLNIAEALAGLK